MRGLRGLSAPREEGLQAALSDRGHCGSLWAAPRCATALLGPVGCALQLPVFPTRGSALSSLSYGAEDAASLGSERPGRSAHSPALCARRVSVHTCECMHV